MIVNVLAVNCSLRPPPLDSVKSAALRAVLGEPGGVRGELAREDAREDRGEAEEGLGFRCGRLGGVRGAPLAGQHVEGAGRE